MTFQRAIYDQTSYVHRRQGQHRPCVTQRAARLRASAWYAMMLGIVLVVSVGLFLLALVVFGRLEGNFAEEL